MGSKQPVAHSVGTARPSCVAQAASLQQPVPTGCDRSVRPMRRRAVNTAERGTWRACL
jgi:hypothetical protein